MSKIKLSENFIKNTVKLALNEDLYPSGDITSNLIQDNKIVKIRLISNQNATIGGLLFVKYAFSLIDNKIKFIVKKKDGSEVKKGSLIGGVWYRNKDAFILTLGVESNMIKVGYSYDVTMSKLSIISGGSHEVSLAINFYCKPKKKKYRPISCPSF